MGQVLTVDGVASDKFKDTTTRVLHGIFVSYFANVVMAGMKDNGIALSRSLVRVGRGMNRGRLFLVNPSDAGDEDELPNIYSLREPLGFDASTLPSIGDVYIDRKDGGRLVEVSAGIARLLMAGAAEVSYAIVYKPALSKDNGGHSVAKDNGFIGIGIKQFLDQDNFIRPENV